MKYLIENMRLCASAFACNNGAKPCRNDATRCGVCPFGQMRFSFLFSRYCVFNLSLTERFALPHLCSVRQVFAVAGVLLLLLYFIHAPVCFALLWQCFCSVVTQSFHWLVDLTFLSFFLSFLPFLFYSLYLFIPFSSAFFANQWMFLLFHIPGVLFFSYSFAAEPRAVRAKGRGGKYRQPFEELGPAPPANIMYDRRVVRGNTYAAQVVPANAQAEAERMAADQGRFYVRLFLSHNANAHTTATCIIVHTLCIWSPIFSVVSFFFLPLYLVTLFSF